MSTAPSASYRPGLSLEDLLTEIGRLLEERRLAERLICRYLADLAARLETEGGALPAADVYQLARTQLGLGVRATRERIRVGRALVELPAIERAFLQDEIRFSQVREITRVATAKDELAWLAAARELPIRQLERRVAEASSDDDNHRTRDAQADAGAQNPATQSPEPASTSAGDVHVVLPAEVWAELVQAMEGARRASKTTLSDAEALQAVARRAVERCKEPEGATDACIDGGRTHGESSFGLGADVRPAAEVAEVRAALSSAEATSGEAVAMTQSGSSEMSPAMTQSGSSETSPNAERIVGAMVAGGGWDTDLLCNATGLSYPEVVCALLDLELAGRVRCTARGYETFALPAATIRGSRASSRGVAAASARLPGRAGRRTSQVVISTSARAQRG